MRTLSCKAVIPVALAVTGFVVVCCFLLYSLIRSDMSDLEVRHGKDLAATIVQSTRQAMINDDRAMLANIIQNIGKNENVEHVRMYNKSGLIVFSKDSGETGRVVDISSAGCMECHAGASEGTFSVKNRRFINEDNKDVFSISSPISNEPSCAGLSCHPSVDSQKVLGVLEVHLSRESVTKTLALLRNRMLLFSLMVLLLTVGGVAALLHRVVFLPLRRLVDFTQERVDGNIMSVFPSTDCELEMVAGGVSLLADRLSEARQEILSLREKEGSGVLARQHDTFVNFPDLLSSDSEDSGRTDDNDCIPLQNFGNPQQRLYPADPGEDS